MIGLTYYYQAYTQLITGYFLDFSTNPVNTIIRYNGCLCGFFSSFLLFFSSSTSQLACRGFAIVLISRTQEKLDEVSKSIGMYLPGVFLLLCFCCYSHFIPSHVIFGQILLECALEPFYLHFPFRLHTRLPKNWPTLKSGYIIIIL